MAPLFSPRAPRFTSTVDWGEPIDKQWAELERRANDEFMKALSGQRSYLTITDDMVSDLSKTWRCPPIHQEAIPMKKFWMIYCLVNNGVLTRFDTLDEAVDEAKRRSNKSDGSVYFVLEAVQAVRSPAPPADVTELKADVAKT